MEKLKFEELFLMSQRNGEIVDKGGDEDSVYFNLTIKIPCENNCD